MSIAPISNDNIKVGYISEDDGYVKGKSIAQANAYEALNPGTTYIFLNGDNKVEYLSIDEVNQLTSKNLLRTDPCKVGHNHVLHLHLNFMVVVELVQRQIQL